MPLGAQAPRGIFLTNHLNATQTDQETPREPAARKTKNRARQKTRRALCPPIKSPSNTKKAPDLSSRGPSSFAHRFAVLPAAVPRPTATEPAAKDRRVAKRPRRTDLLPLSQKPTAAHTALKRPLRPSAGPRTTLFHRAASSCPTRQWKVRRSSPRQLPTVP